MEKQFHFKQFSLACVKQFFLTYRLDLIRCSNSGRNWNYEPWHWRVTRHSPMLQYYWSLTIRLFCVISRIPVGLGVLPLCWLGLEIWRESRKIGSILTFKNSICARDYKSMGHSEDLIVFPTVQHDIYINFQHRNVLNRFDTEIFKQNNFL